MILRLLAQTVPSLALGALLLAIDGTAVSVLVETAQGLAEVV